MTAAEIASDWSLILFTSGFIIATVGNMENDKPLVTSGLYMILFSAMGFFSAWRILQ